MQHRQLLINTLAALEVMAADPKRTLISLRVEYETMYRQARQTFSQNEVSDQQLSYAFEIDKRRFARRRLLRLVLAHYKKVLLSAQRQAVLKKQEVIDTVSHAYNESSLPDAIDALREAGHGNHHTVEAAGNVFVACLNAAHLGMSLRYITEGILGQEDGTISEAFEIAARDVLSAHVELTEK